MGRKKKILKTILYPLTTSQISRKEGSLPWTVWIHWRELPIQRWPLLLLLITILIKTVNIFKEALIPYEYQNSKVPGKAPVKTVWKPTPDKYFHTVYTHLFNRAPQWNNYSLAKWIEQLQKTKNTSVMLEIVSPFHLLSLKAYCYHKNKWLSWHLHARAFSNGFCVTSGKNY